MARRLSQSLTLLVLLSMFSFSLLHIMLGDFAELLLIEQMGGEMPDVDSPPRFKDDNGFQDSLVQQYGRWLTGAVQGDLGTSFQSGGDVWEELRLRLTNSLLLAGVSIVISLLVAVPLGIGAAARPGSVFDRAGLDDLLIKGRGLDAGPERRQTYGRALTIIQDEAPVMPLVHKVYVAASNASVQGFRVHPSGFFYNFKAVRKD